MSDQDGVFVPGYLVERAERTNVAEDAWGESGSGQFEDAVFRTACGITVYSSYLVDLFWHGFAPLRQMERIKFNEPTVESTESLGEGRALH
jgi:hypothetical protein